MNKLKINRLKITIETSEGAFWYGDFFRKWVQHFKS